MGKYLGMVESSILVWSQYEQKIVVTTMFFDQSNASLIYRKLGADLQAPEKGEILKHMHSNLINTRYKKALN